MAAHPAARQASLPLHRKLKDSLTARMAQGEFTPDGRLPSQRALCESYGMSHMTVRRALNELISEGAIFAIPGKGIYAGGPKRDAEAGPLVSFTEDMARRGLVASSRVLEARTMRAPGVVARAMGLEPGARLIYLRRLRLADGVPMALQTSHIRADLCPGLLEHDLERESLFALWRNVYGLGLARSANAVEAGLADEAQAALLGLHRPAALLITEQLTYLDSGQAIEFVRCLYRADRYRLRYGPAA